jgi:predicted MFS family arabinose efflux permease
LVAGALALDRLGKGVRTAPRDSMISLSSSRDKLASAFAVHRALDTGGAIIGPLAAFLLLRLVPGAFDLILVASFCAALVGLGIITLLVEKPVASVAAKPSEMPSLRVSFGLLRRSRYRALVIAGGALGLATVSDGFIYLLLQKSTNSSGSVIPLFAFLTAIFYLVFSVPAGVLADRWGRANVLVGGYIVLCLIYGFLLLPGVGSGIRFVVIGLLGVYYAATDGVLAAMTSAAVTPALCTSGLALLNTVTSVARLLSSILFGFLWAFGAIRTPVWVFLVGLSAAIAVSVLILIGRSEHEPA